MSDILNVRILLILMSFLTQILTFQTYPCFWPADEGEHAMEKYGGYSVEMISEQMDGDIFSKRLALTSQEVSNVYVNRIIHLESQKSARKPAAIKQFIRLL